MNFHQRAGTTAYAAPEVFKGRLTDKTDQYSLAVTYCELRTGRLPFANVPAAFDKAYVPPPPDLDALTTSEQPIVARALSSTPQNRWESCAELMSRLTELLR
jgi:serine/threonine protein kinase